MRPTPVPLLAVAAIALHLAAAAPASAAPLHVLDLEGEVSVREDRFLPPASASPPGPPGADRSPGSGAVPAARAAADDEKKKRTVPGELRRLLRADAIDQPTHDGYRRDWIRARRTLKRLDGRREDELGAVLRNVEDVAARGDLTAGRLPAAFETIRRNRAWWANGKLLSSGARVSFEGSRLVWQAYPGQGLQIQWLGTFGKANGLFQSKKHDRELSELLDEALALAAPRAGGVGFESWFRFGKGRPPWVSALSQGTALQALSRAAVRLGRPGYFHAARAGLGIFRTPPPSGVRVRTDAGAHYLIYSYDEDLRVLNGFVQSLVGLRDFAALANDPEGRTLFTTGEAQLRAEIGRYDTGAWSMYSEERESDLGYHRLVRDFLRNLCGRMRDDLEKATALAAAGAPPAGAVPDPTLYCETAGRFTRYTKEDPVLTFDAVVPAEPRAKKKLRMPYELSKISLVTTRVSRDGDRVAGRRTRLGRGRHQLRFTPRRAGTYRVSVRAVDLAGNATQRTTEIEVRRAKKDD